MGLSGGTRFGEGIPASHGCPRIKGWTGDLDWSFLTGTFRFCFAQTRYVMSRAIFTSLPECPQTRETVVSINRRLRFHHAILLCREVAHTSAPDNRLFSNDRRWNDEIRAGKSNIRAITLAVSCQNRPSRRPRGALKDCIFSVNAFLLLSAIRL